ncbi:MAG: UvrB/UvrC motif-containing protein, partial [Clostridia bacterium]|nr:UvrB/UvrC motif-containing protein [Clostridia bacterium]
KEGLLRSETSLIQTVGRAARNADGKVIMYADTVTGSMKAAIDETARRRKIQSEYNEKNGITPESVKKEIRGLISISPAEKDGGKKKKKSESRRTATKEEREDLIARLESEMKKAAKELRFEEAAYLRDRINALKTTK